MKFDSIDLVRKRDDYIKTFRKAADGLKEGALTPFFYYEGVKVDGKPDDVILFGKVPADVLKALKGEAKAKAEGKCFREKGVLKISVVSGKVPDTKIKAIFKETKNVGYALVEGDLIPGDQKGPGTDTASKAQEMVAQLMGRFDAAKGKVGDDNRKALRERFDAIQKAQAAGDIPKLTKLIDGFDKAMTVFLGQRGITAPKVEDPSAKEKALKRKDDAIARLQKAIPRLTDGERRQVREAWGAVDDAEEQGDWKAMTTAIVAAEQKLIAVLKQALEEEGKASQTSSDKVGSSLAGNVAAQDLLQKITAQSNRVEQLKKAMNPERAKMQKILDALLIQRRKNVDGDGNALPPTPEITQLLNHLQGSRTALENADKTLKTERGKLEKLQADLEKLKVQDDPEAMRVIGAAQKNMAQIEKLLDDVPFDVAQAAISGTVKEMEEATRWHEEQIKREAKAEQDGDQIKPHIAGRHGPQTGLGRQARRAGTAAHVTPDQPGNNAGAPQLVAWNKVDITYTEQGGKRVVKNRLKVAQALVDQMTRAGGGDNSSIWATPVLEKEAVDRALTHARNVKQYVKYVSNSNPGGTDFKSLTILLDKPAKQPGWGYAVKNTSGTYITPADADLILRDFEAGKITEDEMLKKMDVELKSTDGGVDMVEYCRMIFKRSSTSDDWTLLTGYPDAAVTHVGFSPHNNFPSNLRLKDAGGTVSVHDCKVLP
jgi:hypothetical protein